MDLDTDVADRDRLVRTLLTVALATVALRWFRRGKRVRGLLAGGAAAALGFAGTAGRPDLEDVVGVDIEGATGVGLGGSAESDAAREDGQLRCSICGDPIVPGQPRGPDPNDDPAHVACVERRQEG